MPSRGNSDPIDRWMDIHGGSFDESGSWTFNEKGEDILPGILQCSASYYATARITKGVRRCPSPLKMWFLRIRVRLKARRLARILAERCETKTCRSRVSFEYEAWYCYTVVATQLNFIDSGYTYKVECYKV